MVTCEEADEFVELIVEWEARGAHGEAVPALVPEMEFQSCEYAPV